MLTRLLPDQVSKFWDVVKYGIEEALPPIVGGHPDRMNRILASLLSGKMVCWASYRKEKKVTKFEGLCITQIIYDEASHTRNLLIYVIYGYNKTVEDTWIEGFIALIKYAKLHKCNEIVGYTSIPFLVDKAKELGGDASFTYISLNTEKTVEILNSL